jgi:tetratricopeptide (TPR) repeat protein
MQEHKTLGDKHYNNGEYLLAINEYTIGLNSIQDVKLYLNRNLAYMKLSNYEEAYNDAISAIHLDYNNAKIWGRLGSALFALERFKLSYDAFKYSYNLKNDSLILKQINYIKNKYLKDEDTKETKDEDTKETKEEDTKETKDEDTKETKEEDTKETKDEDTEDEDTEDEDIENANNKLTTSINNNSSNNSSNNLEQLKSMFKGVQFNVSNISQTINNILTNDDILNKIKNSDFQNKVFSYKNNMMDALHDKEITGVLNNILKDLSKPN